MSDYYTAASNQAAEIARRQNSGSDARSLIAPEEPDEVICVNVPAFPKKKKETNHQAKNRRQILQLQRQKAKRQSEEHEKVKRQLKSQALKKKKQFGHVKSKVFDSTVKTKSPFDSSSSELTTVGTESTSTITSTIESLTISSAGSDLASGKLPLIDVENISTASRHKDYGRVPEYILKRRISDAKKKCEKSSILNNTLEDPSDGADFGWKKSSARKKILNDLSLQEKALRESLSKLPFGLQSSGSIQKRERLEKELKGIEKRRRSISKKVGMWNVTQGSAVGLVVGQDEDICS